jgi:hypothetical protein
MKLMNKLERRFGAYAIPNLTLYVIIGYIIGYVLQIFGTITGVELLGWFTLNPYYVVHGQIWRIFTWVITPPSDFGIFTLVMLFFYFSIGRELENTMGRFRYNMYIFSGILMTEIGVFILYGIAVLTKNLTVQYVFAAYSDQLITTYYLTLSIFLAFAVCYPDLRVMLYFIIPVKMKWLAVFDGVLLLVYFIAASWLVRIIILISMLNFLIFFLSTRNLKRVSPKEVHRKQEFRRQTKPRPTITRHKCAICGRTEETNPELTFRFCSKCNGNYEYCQEHLFSHTHVQ